MRALRRILALIVMALAATAATTPHVITIFLIGDSTMADKDITDGQQERGWGMALPCCFDDRVAISNHAVNGRSSRSFISEGRWQQVLQLIRPGDYVVIQFGHNDEKPQPERHTDPGSTFDYNLARFVRETRQHGGIPVLMNSVARRNFMARPPRHDDDEALRTTAFSDSADDAGEGDTLVDTHGLYAVAPRDVASRMHCHFVDANRLTSELEQSLGREGSKRLHVWFRPGEEPSVPEGRQDNTHYSVYGAHVVAQLLADALCREVPLLQPYRTQADITVDRQGRGDFITLTDALAAIDPLQPCTVQLLGGEWERPRLPRRARVTFILRMGAVWKN